MPALPPAAILPLFLCAAVLTLGCAGAQNGAMQRIVDSWRNVPVEQVQAQWGPPQSVQTSPAGTAYIWIDEIPVAHPPGSGPRDARLEPPVTTARCQRKLLAGADGKVSHGEWSGDACCVQTLVGLCAGLARKASGPTG